MLMEGTLPNGTVIYKYKKLTIMALIFNSTTITTTIIMKYFFTNVNELKKKAVSHYPCKNCEITVRTWN